ncbi:outer membrane beta-barrel family protein [Emticicia sp. C21]|uniref:outer membrane beta-barrel family protein n=1 Tax=Emticicia sp. C21 TaxID=2302915 RepID=UPI000E34EE84|nr:outer membrane beta-barrel family protein [Emticicia sp. C21]RFS16393.1 TonB-dependent receptor [Emticicia sp. C21]
MYKKLFFLFFITSLAQAQNGTIKGLIKDDKKEAVVGATIILSKGQKGILKSSFTDVDGKFEFEKLKYDTLLVEVSFVGMNKYTSGKIILNAQNSTIDLGSITLTNSTNELQEVAVTAQKAFVVQKIDRTVINPEALISNAGVTSLEVLEKAPGVTVDINGNISLRGKGGVVVFVDDKPTYLSASDLANYLRTIPSSTIESIEIMTNPPAKYDAAGNSGVINIRLKKNLARGMNGGLNLSYGQGRFMRTNNSFNFNYRINKFNFFSNLSANQNSSYQDLTITRKYFTPEGQLSSTFIQNSYIRPTNRSNNLKLGLDYYITKKTTIGVALSGFINPSSRNLTNKAAIRNGQNEITGLVDAYNPTDILFKNGSVNLNMTHQLNTKGREISVNLDNIVYKSKVEQRLENKNLNPDGGLINKSILESNLPSDISIRAAKIDYLNPLAKGGRIEAGAKTSFVKTGNIADFYDVVDDQKVPNYTFSNNFQYKENINAVYLNYSRDFKKISIQAGLRLENTSIVGNQLGNIVVKDSSFKRNYTNLFPTFYTQYKIDSASKHVIGLSIGRRIDRPNYRDMNPFTYPMDRFTYYGGNPFLQPTFSYNAELSYTYNNMVTTTLQYSQSNNVISETNEQRGNIYYSRPGNFAKQISYGVEVNGTFKIQKWWTLQLYTAYLNNKFESPIYTETLNDSRWFWVVVPTNQFVINKKWSAELAGSYQTKVLSGQFLVIPIGSIRAGVSTKILKDKGTLRLNVNDVFYTNQVGGDIRNIKNAVASWFSYLDTRVVTISFAFRFSKGQTLKVRQNGGSESEQQRVKAS